MVVEVMAGSPAAIGGLKPCDLIEQVGGKAVRNPSEVQLAVDQGTVGQPLAVALRRGEQRLNLELKPKELPRRG